MFRRLVSYVLMVSLVGSSVLWSVTASAAAIGMTQVYNYAKSGNLTALKALKKSGKSIEVVDKYGNTAMCRSIWMNDYASFYVLKEAGASITSPCVSQVPPNRVQAFNKGYMSWAKNVNAGRIAYPIAVKAPASAAVTADTVPASQQIIETSTGLSTGTKVAIGVGAVALIGGGIALAAGGGGGGGSSSSAPAPCSGRGTQDADGICVCNTGYAGDNCETCDTGFGKHSTNECHANLVCVNGTQQGSSCVCDPGFGNYGTTECHQTLSCQNGSEQKGGSCDCLGNWTGLLCDRVGGTNNATIAKTYSTNADLEGESIIGMEQTSGDNFANARSSVDKQHAEGTITLTIDSGVTAATDVYGMKYNAGTNNDYQLFANANNTAANYSAKGTISITNNSSGVSNIYGIYTDKPGYKSSISGASPWWLNAISKGTAELKRLSGSLWDVDGLKNEALTSTKQDGIVRITNTSNADVWGLYGLGYGFNAYDRGWGLVDINNTGNGNITGGLVMFNGIHQGQGFINIKNTGSGNVTGQDGIRNACGTGIGYIMIDNTGDGTVTGLKGSYNACKGASGTIYIENAGTGNVYGVSYNSTYRNNFPDSSADGVWSQSTGYALFNGFTDYQPGTGYDGIGGFNVASYGDVSLNVKSSKPTNVYGLYYDFNGTVNENAGDSNNMTGVYNAYAIKNATGSASGEITINLLTPDAITNTSGRGKVYGVYGNTKYTAANAYAAPYDGQSTEHSDTRDVTGNITIQTSDELGDLVYDIYGVYNAIGNVYNIYREDIKTDDTRTASAWVDIDNNTNGNTFGLFSNGTKSGTVVSNGSTKNESNYMYLDSSSTGLTVGMYVGPGKSATEQNRMYNYGTINIGESLANQGKAIGMYVDDYVTAYNYGTIDLMTNTASGTYYGAYVSSNGTFYNEGEINLFYNCCGANPAHVGKAYGIYGEKGATIVNNGTIGVGLVDGMGEVGGSYTTKGNITGNKVITGESGRYYYYVATGDTHEGIIASPKETTTASNSVTHLMEDGKEVSVLNLDTLFGEDVENVLDRYGSYGDTSLDFIQGKLGVASAVTSTGFLDEYRVTDAILAQDTSGLNLYSKSALFDASLNGKDVIMTMKSFDEVVDNKSLANFLSSNYAAGMNESFFNTLKSFETRGALTNALDSMSSLDTLTRFTNEDLTVMREVNLAMNDMIFAHNNDRIYEANGSLGAFGFKNDRNSNAQFALGNKRVSSRVKIGYAMSKTDMNTDDDRDTTRRNSLFQVFMPVSYNRAGWQMIATPQLGYARAHYTRDGYQGQYDGVIEKRIFALMNEARYPLSFGGLELSPTVEFNAIAYNQKGSEDAKAFALTMPSDNNLSVEAGVGLRAKRTLGNLSLTGSIMAYREFADPYNIKLGMYGLNGTFDLYDDVQEYRGKASFGFNYKKGTIDLYGIANHYMQRDGYTTLKTGLKFAF